MTNINVQFSSTTLVVDDLDKMAEFYKAVCGLTEMARMSAQVGGRDITEILFNRDEGGATFVVLKYEGQPAPPTGETINVFNTDNLDGFVQRALQHGAVIVDPPTENADYGVRYSFLKDPEGHLLGGIQMPS